MSNQGTLKDFREQSDSIGFILTSVDEGFEENKAEHGRLVRRGLQEFRGETKGYIKHWEVLRQGTVSEISRRQNNQNQEIYWM